MAYDVVISFNSADEAAARVVRQACLDAKLTVYLSHADGTAGRPWDAEFFKAMADTTVVLALCGPFGLGPIQQVEVAHAAERLKVGPTWFRLIPVLLPQADSELPEELRDLNRIILGAASPGYLSQGGLRELTTAVLGARVEREHGLGDASAEVPVSIPNWRVHSEGRSARALPTLPGAAHRCVEKLGKKDVVFMLGAWHACADAPHPAVEVANALLSELGLPAVRERYLMQPSFVSAWHENKLGSDKTVRCISDELGRHTAGTERTDNLVARMMELAMRRTDEGPRPVVVSARADLALERALVARGVPFVRLVYGADKDCFIDGVSEIRRAESGGWDIRYVTEHGPSQETTIPDQRDRIEVKLREAFKAHHYVACSFEMPTPRSYNPPHTGHQPVLVKLMGCDTHTTSRVYSQIQLNALAANITDGRLIPGVVREAFAESHVVFLGCNAIDPELHLMLHLFLGKRRKGLHRILLMPSSDQARFGDLWPIERDAREALSSEAVALVECEEEAFLASLVELRSQR